MREKNQRLSEYHQSISKCLESSKCSVNSNHYEISLIQQVKMLRHTCSSAFPHHHSSIFAPATSPTEDSDFPVISTKQTPVAHQGLI